MQTHKLPAMTVNYNVQKLKVSCQFGNPGNSIELLQTVTQTMSIKIKVVYHINLFMSTVMHFKFKYINSNSKKASSEPEWQIGQEP
jgi:Ca2+/H+ antiporter